jgi:hypothetical protein
MIEASNGKISNIKVVPLDGSFSKSPIIFHFDQN